MLIYSMHYIWQELCSCEPANRLMIEFRTENRMPHVTEISLNLISSITKQYLSKRSPLQQQKGCMNTINTVDVVLLASWTCKWEKFFALNKANMSLVTLFSYPIATQAFIDIERNALESQIVISQLDLKWAERINIKLGKILYVMRSSYQRA